MVSEETAPENSSTSEKVPNHNCAPRLSIPYNPVPQDSMEIYSSAFPSIEHEPYCAYVNTDSNNESDRKNNVPDQKLSLNLLDNNDKADDS